MSPTTFRELPSAGSKGSSFRGLGVDGRGVRIRRLELITPTGRSALRLHRDVTVVTGLGRLEREALSVELIGAIGPGRSGLCVDVTMEDGSRIDVVRPLDEAAFAFDETTGLDRSDEFREGDRGPIDPLGSLGLERHRHRSFIRLGRRELQHARNDRERYDVLAALPPGDLWPTAETIVSLDRRLRDAAAGERRAAVTAKALAADVEDAHAHLEQLIDNESLSNSELITTLAALVALGIGATIATALPVALPFFGAGAGLIAWRRHQRWAIERARHAERVALARSGASSYLDHQLRRVDGLTGIPHHRASTLDLIEQQRRGHDRWSILLGDDHLDISPQWAIEHRSSIEAHRIQRIDLHHEPSLGSGDPAALVRHLDRVAREVGEPLPLVLDDPFCDLDDFDLTAVLTLLDDMRTRVQVVVMTDDPRIVGWAVGLAETERAIVVHLGGETEPMTNGTSSPSPVPQLI